MLFAPTNNTGYAKLNAKQAAATIYSYSLRSFYRQFHSNQQVSHSPLTSMNQITSAPLSAKMVFLKSNLHSKYPLISTSFLFTLFLIYIPSCIAIRPYYLSGPFPLQPVNTIIFTHKNGGGNGVGMARPGNGFGKDRFIGKQHVHVQSIRPTVFNDKNLGANGVGVVKLGKQQPVKPAVFNDNSGGANGVGMVRLGNGFGKGHDISEQHLQPIKPTVLKDKNSGANCVIAVVRPANGFIKGHVFGERHLQTIKTTVFNYKNSGASAIGMVRPGNEFGKGRRISVFGKDSHPRKVHPSVVKHNYHAATSGLNRFFKSDSGYKRKLENVVVDHLADHTGNHFDMNKSFGSPRSEFGERRRSYGVGGDWYGGKHEQQLSEGFPIRRKAGEVKRSVSPPAGIGK